MTQLDLVLDPFPQRGTKPGPRQPTVIPQIPETLVQFRDLAALAKHLHRERRQRGLQLFRGTASHGGSDTFTAFRVMFDDDYAFTIAGVGDSLASLQAAIAAANPHQP